MTLPVLTSASKRERISRALELMFDYIRESNTHNNRNFSATVRTIRRQFDLADTKKPEVEFPAVFINQPGEEPTSYLGRHIERWTMTYAAVCWLYTPESDAALRLNAFLADIEMALDRFRGLRIDTTVGSNVFAASHGYGKLYADPPHESAPANAPALCHEHQLVRYVTSEGYLAPYQKIYAIFALRYDHTRGIP